MAYKEADQKRGEKRLKVIKKREKQLAKKVTKGGRHS